MYNVGRVSKKLSVSAAVYIIVECLAFILHHPLPEQYIHGVLVFILKIRTKLFQKSFFVKMTQSYN